MVPDAKAVAEIKAMQPDTTKFLIRQRGFVDYKFSELARYRGYQAACIYAESVLRWHDIEKYRDCLLITSYEAFRAADK